MNTQTIEERNAAFEALTVEQKRVKIAQDVIDLMAANVVVAGNSYLDVWADNWYYRSDEQFVDELPKKAMECKVCALGAVFVGHIFNVNHMTTREMTYATSYDMRDKLVDVFDYEQLLLIEDAYEGFSESMFGYNNAQLVMDWRRDYMYEDGEYIGRDKLLRAIMENIIRNNGTFIID